jgi:hypothetical protein
MPDPMNTFTVESALHRLGAVLGDGPDIEILLVGGAAGMITGLLPPTRVTTDCDVMAYLPLDTMATVELAAVRVAEELGLASNWLNSDVQIRLDALPDGWEQRKIAAGMFGRLKVSAVSRPDLIAMKVLAGRDQDIEDLQAIRVRSDDVEFIEAYLNMLANKGTHQDQIDGARELLASLEVHDHE